MGTWLPEGDGPPDLKEGQCCLQWTSCGVGGVSRWLCLAAHAVLHIHKAQTLPPFPLLRHLS